VNRDDLLIERALRTLDDAEQRELDGVDDASFDVAAAAAVLATTRVEPMPAHVAAKILAAAPQPDFKRTLAGVMPPGPPRDTLVGADLASFAPPSATPAATAVDELAARRDQRASIRPRRSLVPWLAAAACLLVAGGAVWWALRKDRVAPADDSRASLVASGEAQTIAWTATPDPAATGATGDVVWSQARQAGYMRFVGLAPNDPREYQYQLWIFDKDRDQAFPVDGGVFDVTSTGEVIVPIAAKLHVGEATLFAVTIERPGGVVVSKRERIVVTAARS
jgi:anti-sigma-K factor RskA